MRWIVHSEKAALPDPWLDIRVADVELPDGRHLEHRLIRARRAPAAVVVHDGQALLLWRHRFITGSGDGRSRSARSIPARTRRGGG